MEVNQNWTTQKQVLPISLQATPFDHKLLKAPGTLKELIQQYKQKSQILDKSQENKPNSDFFDNIAIDIFLFVAAIISMLAVIAIIHLACRHVKLKALLTGIAFQPVERSRSSGTLSNKGVLYSTVVCNCSLNNADNTTYCLYLSVHSKVYHIQKKTLFKYSNYYAILFRCQAVYCSKTV